MAPSAARTLETSVQLLTRRPGLTQHSTKWWTKERVLYGLRRCFEDFKQLPTNADDYHALTQHTGEIRNGRPSTRAWYRRYPSYGPISNYFGGMREAWNEVAKHWPELNIIVDRGYEEWSQEEDWFIKESVGVIPRAEVSRLMRRTEAAIKRRLYDLGEGHCYSLRGWTINHISSVLKVSRKDILKYIRRGELPFFQGNKCIYVDPADLPVIREHNWKKKQQPKELDQAVRAGLVKRLCFVLLGYDWRKYSYYQVQPVRNFKTGAERSSLPSQTPQQRRPKEIRVGSWVRVISASPRKDVIGRIGRVLAITWPTDSSPGRRNPPCWMATVEFRKCRVRGRPNTTVVSYRLRLDSLEKTHKPGNMRQPRLVPGNWVRVTKAVKDRFLLRRAGQIRSLRWHSPQRSQTGSASLPPCWMAQVEFPKGKPLGSPKLKSVTYSVPVSDLKEIPTPDWRVPGDLKVGCWARLTRDVPCYRSKGRIGRVVSLQFRAKDRRAARRGVSSWIAKLEFTKHPRYQRQTKKIIQFCVPVAYLERVRKPYSRTSMTPGVNVTHFISTPPKTKRELSSKAA